MSTRHLSVALVIWICSAATGNGANIGGVITDDNDDPVPGVKVAVFADDFGADTELAPVYTNASGIYSTPLNPSVVSNNDLYIT